MHHALILCLEKTVIMAAPRFAVLKREELCENGTRFFIIIIIYIFFFKV